MAADETRGAGDEDGHNDLRTGNALQNEWEERRAHAYNVSFRDGTLKLARAVGARPAIEKHPFAKARSFPIASRKILSLP